jgi:drug/metabolite transporter (DMT)-like permease
MPRLSSASSSAAAHRRTTHAATNPGRFSALDWTLFFTAASVFGASFLFMAICLRAFDAGVVSFGRIALGWLALSAVGAARRPIDRADWPRIAALGVTWLGIPLSLFPLAQQHIDSSLAGMINGSTPLFVATVAAVLLRRLPSRRQVVGLGLGTTGLLLVASPALGEGASSALGVGLVVGAVSCYGIAFNLAVPLQQRYGALPVLWRAQLVGMAVCAPRFVAGLPSSDLGAPASWAALAVLGAAGTGLAYVATGTLSGRVGSTRAAVITYAATPVSMVLGVVFRSEVIAAVALLGAAMTLGGAWVTSRAER